MTPPRRAARALLLVLVAVLAAGLPGWPAAAQPQPPGPGDSPAAVDEGHLDRGKTLYQVSCAGCHGQSGAGSQLGPSLIGVGEASIDFQLQTGRMPIPEEQASPQRGDPAFGEADIDALVTYVSSFGEGGPGIPAVRPGDLQLGRELYLQNCSGCHSSTGIGYAQVGGRVAPSVLETDPVQVAEAVRVGPNLMPAFPESVLDQEQLDAIVTYVRELQQLQGRGGADIGRVGPVTETLVGFAGLALLLVLIRRLGRRAR
jgi:ubiquinol-cytochrome c reductase cytochrome c subunit